MPGLTEPYRWAALPEKQHLFEKHLSKHCLRAYMQICAEVGRPFEAISADHDVA
jgi:hypothetical protein